MENGDVKSGYSKNGLTYARIYGRPQNLVILKRQFNLDIFTFLTGDKI